MGQNCVPKLHHIAAVGLPPLSYLRLRKMLQRVRRIFDLVSVACHPKYLGNTMCFPRALSLKLGSTDGILSSLGKTDVFDNSNNIFLLWFEKWTLNVSTFVCYHYVVRLFISPAGIFADHTIRWVQISAISITITIISFYISLFKSLRETSGKSQAKIARNAPFPGNGWSAEALQAHPINK